MKLLERLGSVAWTRLEFEPRYNIAPTQPVLAVVNDAARSARELRWGLVPRFAASPEAVKLSTFNARIETIATAATYRDAFRFKRCVVIADGFYEWRRNDDGSKTPYWIHRADEGPFPFAGLWDEWRSRNGEASVSSCTLITAPANAFMADVHSRMPIALDVERARRWLTDGELDARDGMDMLVPAELAPDWTMHPVSPRVGNVRNDDAGLIALCEPQEPVQLPFA